MTFFFNLSEDSLQKTCIYPEVTLEILKSVLSGTVAYVAQIDCNKYGKNVFFL